MNVFNISFFGSFFGVDPCVKQFSTMNNFLKYPFNFTIGMDYSTIHTYYATFEISKDEFEELSKRYLKQKILDAESLYKTPCVKMSREKIFNIFYLRNNFKSTDECLLPSIDELDNDNYYLIITNYE